MEASDLISEQAQYLAEWLIILAGLALGIWAVISAVVWGWGLVRDLASDDNSNHRSAAGRMHGPERNPWG